MIARTYGAIVAILLTPLLALVRPDLPPQGSAADRSQPGMVDLTVPAGFEVERVAGPPLVDRPIVADFDEQGRLYVADSSGSNDKTEKQLADRPHRIVRLEDKNGDGRFDTSVVFADRMMLPEGTMWFDGSLYVAAPPSIWKLTDTTGDGVADLREEWFQGKTLTGCANDLHGPYLGPDGWIYWTKGAFAQQTYERPGKPPLVTRASHIFRRRPGDASIEPVMTGGMDNPVDVVFTPGGERLFTATFLEHPQVGRRDALVHAIYGGVYGKPHAVIDGHKRTGDLMPVLLQLGPDVPAGLTRYASQVFGAEYRDNLFAAMFNVRKVTRHVLEADGATFKTHNTDFVVSQHRDFHPTDVIEDADGSLLVVDTGPWYKLCCPSSQLAKPEVFGAIYRVRRKGAAAVSDPRGLKLSWNTMPPRELTQLLDDGRPAVQLRTLQRLGEHGAAALAPLVDVLRSSRSVEARRNAVWALTRIQSDLARAAVRLALDDRDHTVRQAAGHSASLWRDTGATAELVAALKSNVPALQRVAAEALGRIGDRQAVPHLLAAAATPVDRTLEHSLTYALIEIGDPSSTAAAGLQAGSSRAKRAALIALDQMDGGGLKVDSLLPLLDSADPVLKDTAWWIAARHPEWGMALAGYFEARLADVRLTAAALDELQQKLAQFGADAAIQALLASTVERAESAAVRVTALRAMAGSRVKELPAIWIASLVRALGDRDADVVRQAVSVARGAPLGSAKATAPELRLALLRVASDRSRAIDARLDALTAIQPGLAPVESDVFDLLRGALDSNQPPAIRGAAAAVLERARLDAAQLLALAETMGTVGPLELSRLLPAFDHASDERVGIRMVAALEQSKGRSGLRAEILRPRLAKYPEAVQKRGEALLASLDVDAAKQSRRLEELLTALTGGDIVRGQDVFNGPKAACLSCHAIGYMGGRIGPDLTQIGQVRSERDLLEAILFPNASFARGFEPISVTTTSGEVHGGVLRSDSREEVVLGTGAGQEIRIARQNIKNIESGTVSLMPVGLESQLTRQELADLLAFLKNTRRGAN
jgi:putative membrane-bound dehydrogenase-like protein